jgi:hypothetical protein
MASARSAVPLCSRNKSSRILKDIPSPFRADFELEAGRTQNTIARGSHRFVSTLFGRWHAAYTFRSSANQRNESGT